jgi:PiT family inorganic phosphate transporter
MKMRLTRSKKIKNNRKSVNALFVIPLVFSAALLSFAHGANDVANAIWPLAAIYDAVINGAISGEVGIPLWIMVLGVAGLSIGLLLYGPKIIKTVGTEITELDQMRAFCIALSAAITVIIASQLGLPVSSTHIALGWVFGVGFLREYLDRRHNRKRVQYVRRDILKKIIAAWLITVPVVSFISACIFLVITKVSM